MAGGYMGKILFVDLSTGKLEEEKQRALDALFHGRDLLDDEPDDEPEPNNEPATRHSSWQEFEAGSDRIFSDEGAGWDQVGGGDRCTGHAS